MYKKKQINTTWEPVQKWYRKSVGDEGHYYHQQIVLPGVLRLLNLNNEDRTKVLDVACGQGVLARALPLHITYTGLDISASFIKEARQKSTHTRHEFIVADVTKSFPIKDHDYTHATIILALQNIAEPLSVLRHVHKHLQKQGKLCLVLNHPCFRIPRQSSWQVDQDKKIQFRRLDRYATPMSIPIQAHPSKGEKSVSTLSFHHPLSDYSRWLKEAGYMIESIEEWCSDKVSVGSAAKMENRSREEFPLFLAMSAIKF